MAFKRSHPASLSPSPVKRAALYLRVSTGRQAVNDVSLPSQRDLNTAYCGQQGWEVVAEFVEPGASATDDRRPVFQEMLERAAAPERPFDVIVVHAFSRFFRNGAEMELTIRRLKKLGVSVVSVTQPTGDDPSQELMRQLIGVFDEYTSKENAKNVVRSMRESAKQGFWNGARPPLGYRAVEAERRGAKIKKKLEIDPVEAETVRLIYRLYTDGGETGRPMGIKEVVKHLNRHGYRTRLGATFGVGPLHLILKNETYATGRCAWGKRRAVETGDPSAVVEIPVPPIIERDIFDRVQEKLAAHNPRVTPPRIVNGPTLLTGLAVCEACGSGMTRTGTNRRGVTYSYYTCAGCRQRGDTVCKGRHIRMETLDDLVVDNLKDKLLHPERLAAILTEIVERRSAKAAAINDRLIHLRKAAADAEERLKRLYRSIEEGIVELDDLLKERISILKAERENARAAHDRAIATSGYDVIIDAEKVEAFSRLMHEKMTTGDVHARKDVIRSVVSGITVGDGRIRIIGDKTVLAAAVSGQRNRNGFVRGFVREWRALRESNPSLQRERLPS